MPRALSAELFLSSSRKPCYCLSAGSWQGVTFSQASERALPGSLDRCPHVVRSRSRESPPWSSESSRANICTCSLFSCQALICFSPSSGAADCGQIHRLITCCQSLPLYPCFVIAPHLHLWEKLPPLDWLCRHFSYGFHVSHCHRYGERMALPFSLAVLAWGPQGADPEQRCKRFTWEVRPGGLGGPVGRREGREGRDFKVR